MEFHIYFFIHIFIYTVCKIPRVLSENPLFWDNHVYTGRHFDNLVTTTKVGPPNVIRPALLILYSAKCEQNVNFLTKDLLPADHLMVFAKHDYDRFPKWIWYKFDERDNLAERYKPIKNCAEYLFFKNGSSLSKPERYIESEDTNVLSWIYDRIKISFKITNNRKRAVEVNFETKIQTSEEPRFIYPRQTVELESYISSIFYIIEGTALVYAKVIDSTFPSKMIISDDDKTDSDLDDIDREIHAAATKSAHWRRSLAALYLLNFKLPVILPKFTKVGYKKGKIPKELYDTLLTFYNENKQYRKDEHYNNEPAINSEEVKCGMVQVDDDNLQLVNEFMLPLLEEWSNCTLKPTYIYGIREYYTGNVLRNHVDRVATHVISVIFQISKNLGTQKDWPLEIIDFNGIRKQVYLEPGEMLYYESTTLIHGRPEPFKGNVFANIFIHYKPVKNWDWNEEYGEITKAGKTVDKVTAMTPIKDKFPKIVKYHDEL